MTPRFLIFFTAIVLFFLHADQALAAKPRVVKRGAPVVSVSGYSSARLSRATNSVVVSFFNLNRAKKITYELSYSTQGIPQGVIGSMVPAGKTSDSRDLYFGTCSKGVCTPHYNITGATLTVTTQLTSGATNTKRYRIKV